MNKAVNMKQQPTHYIIPAITNQFKIINDEGEHA